VINKKKEKKIDTKITYKEKPGEKESRKEVIMKNYHC